MGRRLITFAFVNPQGVPVTARVEGVWPIGNGFGSSDTWANDAALLGSVVVAANATATLTITQPPTPFIALTASGGGIGPGLDFTLTMVD
jgi:hypothetical protein